MYECLKGLEPARVFELFGELCRIPHGSKNEKAISDYICRFCEDRGLECKMSAAGGGSAFWMQWAAGEVRVRMFEGNSPPA